MGARGRKSKAEKETAQDLELATPGELTAVDRPEPPLDLSDEQAEEWRAIVTRMPADWFPVETHGLLRQYCRHLVAARHVGQLIIQHEDIKKNETLDIDTYDQLLKMQEREGRAMSSLATRMRITQQSQYDKSRPRGSKAKKPWEQNG